MKIKIKGVSAFCCTAVFLFILPLSALGQDNNKEGIEEHLSSGKSLYRQERFRDAIKEWEKVLSLDPGNNRAKRYIERAEERIKESPAGQAEASAPRLEAPKKVAPVISEKTSPEETPVISVHPDLLPFKDQHVRILTLKECIHTAVSRSLSLKAAGREIKLSRQKIKDAWRALFPAASLKYEKTDGTTTGENFKGLGYSLELQQPLYQGGKLVNTLRQARVNMQVARGNYLKLKNDLVYEVEQAYHILDSTKKTYRQLVELITLAKKDYISAGKEFKLGLTRELDYLTVKNLFQESEYKLLSTEKDLTLAYLTLYQTLDIDPQEETIDIPETPAPKILNIDLEKAQQIAVEHRPDLKVKKLLYRFNKYGIQIAKSGNRLKIDLTGSIGKRDEVFITENLDLQNEWYVGLKGSMPLWLNTLEYSFVAQDKVPSAGQTTSTEFQSHTATLHLFDNTAYTSITEAEVNLNKAKDELQKIEKSVIFETKQDFYEYQKAVYQLSNTSTKLKMDETELAVVSAQKDLNMASTGDLLRTRVKLWDAKTSYNQAAAGYFTSIAKLNKTIGVSGYFDPMGETQLQDNTYYTSPPAINTALAGFSTPLSTGGQPSYAEPIPLNPAPKNKDVAKTAPKPEGPKVKEKNILQNFSSRTRRREIKNGQTAEKQPKQKKLALAKKEQDKLAMLEKHERKTAELKKLLEEKHKKDTKTAEQKRLAQIKKAETAITRETARRIQKEKQKKLALAKKEQDKLTMLEKYERKTAELKKLLEEKHKKDTKTAEQKRLAQIKKAETAITRETARRIQKEKQKKLALAKKESEFLAKLEKKESRSLSLYRKAKERGIRIAEGIRKKQLEILAKLSEEKEEKESTKRKETARIKKQIKKEKEAIVSELAKEEELRREKIKMKEKRARAELVALETAGEKEAEDIHMAQLIKTAKKKEKEETAKILRREAEWKRLALAATEEKRVVCAQKEKAAQEKKRRYAGSQRLESLKRQETENMRKEALYAKNRIKGEKKYLTGMEEREKMDAAAEAARAVRRGTEEDTATKKYEEWRLAQLMEKERQDCSKGIENELALFEGNDTYQTAIGEAKDRLAMLDNEKKHLVLVLETQAETEKKELQDIINNAGRYYRERDYLSAEREWYKALVLDRNNRAAIEGIKRAETALKKGKSTGKPQG